MHLRLSGKRIVILELVVVTLLTADSLWSRSSIHGDQTLGVSADLHIALLLIVHSSGPGNGEAVEAGGGLSGLVTTTTGLLKGENWLLPTEGCSLVIYSGSMVKCAMADGAGYHMHGHYQPARMISWSDQAKEFKDLIVPTRWTDGMNMSILTHST